MNEPRTPSQAIDMRAELATAGGGRSSSTRRPRVAVSGPGRGERGRVTRVVVLMLLVASLMLPVLAWFGVVEIKRRAVYQLEVDHESLREEELAVRQAVSPDAWQQLDRARGVVAETEMALRDVVAANVGDAYALIGELMSRLNTVAEYELDLTVASMDRSVVRLLPGSEFPAAVRVQFVVVGGFEGCQHFLQEIERLSSHFRYEDLVLPREREAAGRYRMLVQIAIPVREAPVRAEAGPGTNRDADDDNDDDGGTERIER